MELIYPKCRYILGFTLCLCLLLLSAASARGQDKITVTGNVSDENDIPIAGANISVKNTVNGTFTDYDGNYSIVIDGPGGVLVFSFLGYETVEVAIGDRKNIDVKLLPDANVLDEVVAIGYGTQKKASVIGAISSIDVENLKMPSSQLSSNLAGQLAGVISMSRSGEPGKNSAADFYIRGVSSFQGTVTPLVLVDGIERDLDLVDTDDIESFSILKDASASAVYGVRGANGVIIITTKKGNVGRPEIKVRAEAGMTSPTVMPKFVNSEQWALMYNEATGTQRYSVSDIEMYRNGTDPDLYPNVDWINTLYRNMAANQRVNVSVTGGGEVARYYISGSFYNESSIFRNAGNIYDYDSSINYNKFNFRANVDVNLTRTTVLNVNLANIYEKSFAPGSSTGNIWSYAFSTSPNAFPSQYTDGTVSAPSQATGYNPWNLLVHSGYSEQFWNSAQSLIGLTQDFEMITKGLTASIKFSWDAWNTQLQSRTKEPQQYHATGRDEFGDLIFGSPIYSGSETLTLSQSGASSITTYLEGSINYNRVFANDHRVGALFLYNHKITRRTFSNNAGLLNVDATTSLPYKNQGIAARVTYAFRDKYLFEFNMGYNGSENFAPGHRFGFFPAVSVGYRISEEKFWSPLKNVFNDFKFKASYGKVGNDQLGSNDRWLYLSTIITSGNSFVMGESGGNGGTGIAMGRPENLNFSWEEETKLNAGIEFTLFNQLRFQGDYFRSHRTGILMTRGGLPGIAGFQNSAKLPYVNIGETQNQGVDMSLEWDRRFGEWYVTARGNFTYNRNKLLNNDEPDWAYKYQNRIGKPYGVGGAQPWGYLALGLFESQDEIDNSPTQTFGEYRVGDIKYADINGDGRVDSQDQIYLGYTDLPEITYGFGATVQWKGIDLNVFFQGISHVNFFLSGSSIRSPFSSSNMERSAIQYDVWEKGWRVDRTDSENAAAVYPRLSYGTETGATNNQQTSSWWMRNGAFLRLKNIELGYTLPKKWMTRTGFMKSMRFYVSANNLCTFSEFKLWDPEMGGGDGGSYPPNRIISIGLNANF
ncbi:MAG: TonB-dependent receptor [Bacteroidales bacterium]|nr:TonB-dependent receptor [Bacteroidales bacterium]